MSDTDVVPDSGKDSGADGGKGSPSKEKKEQFARDLEGIDRLVAREEWLAAERRPWDAQRCLELMAIGAMLADKGLRRTLPAKSFSEWKYLRGAVEELQTSKDRTDWPMLSSLLGSLGVTWNGLRKEVMPLDAVVGAIRLNSEVRRVLAFLSANLCESTIDDFGCEASEAQKRSFLRSVAHLQRDLKMDLSVTNDRK